MSKLKEMFKTLLKPLTAFFPDYSTFHRLGFKALTHRQEFILHKSYADVEVYFCQTMDSLREQKSLPFQPSRDEAILILKFSKSVQNSLIAILRHSVDYYFELDEVHYAILKNTDFHDPKWSKAIAQIDSHLKS